MHFSGGVIFLGGWRGIFPSPKTSFYLIGGARNQSIDRLLQNSILKSEAADDGVAKKINYWGREGTKARKRLSLRLVHYFFAKQQL